MTLFDDGFDMEDATLLGAAAGFAEESIKAEEANPYEDSEDEIDVDISQVNDDDLRLIRNANPGLFSHIVDIIKKQAVKWRKDRIAREEVAEELEALRETEEMLEELGEDHDS
jgi:hypothetical protein